MEQQLICYTAETIRPGTSVNIQMLKAEVIFIQTLLIFVQDFNLKCYLEPALVGIEPFIGSIMISYPETILKGEHTYVTDFRDERGRAIAHKIYDLDAVIFRIGDTGVLLVLPFAEFTKDKVYDRIQKNQPPRLPAPPNACCLLTYSSYWMTNQKKSNCE